MTHLPLCIVVTGMAGTGKSTFVNALNVYITKKLSKNSYIINLDPAVMHIPYHPNIDIRDTINYKDVQRQYGLGPNGAITTCLNLFATKIDELMQLIEKHCGSGDSSSSAEAATIIDYIIIDTPGQIEVFYWSASGSVITGCLASAFPTVVIYIMDTPLCHNPNTFMSNMLYACGILYKYQLPFIVAMNKVDIIDCAFAQEWMRDFEEFNRALTGLDNGNANASVFSSSSVTNSAFNNLSYSLSLVLDTFYAHLQSCGVSALSGEGIDKFITLCDQSQHDYWNVYRAKIESYKRDHCALQSKIEQSNRRAQSGFSSKHDIKTENVRQEMLFNSEPTDDYDNARDSDESNKLEEESFERFIEKVKATKICIKNNNTTNKDSTT